MSLLVLAYFLFFFFLFFFTIRFCPLGSTVKPKPEKRKENNKNNPRIAKEVLTHASIE